MEKRLNFLLPATYDSAPQYLVVILILMIIIIIFGHRDYEERAYDNIDDDPDAFDL